MGGFPFSRQIRLAADAYGNGEHVFHLTFRALPGTRPFGRVALGEAVWKLVLEQQDRKRVRTIAACLMPDHLHILLKPADLDVVSWVREFKSHTTRVAWRHGLRGALWQPSFYDRRIRDDEEFERTLWYIRQNPVADGLVNEPEEWGWTFVAGDLLGPAE
jgi:putative transposase